MTLQELLDAIKLHPGWYLTTTESYTTQGPSWVEVANQTKWLSIEYFPKDNHCSIELYMTRISNDCWAQTETSTPVIANTVDGAMKVIRELLETKTEEPKIEGSVPEPMPEPTPSAETNACSEN
jgi:hypothetical protein